MAAVQYPPPQQHFAPQPGYPQPPPAKKFRFQLWMLGALILPIGIGIAVRDVLKRNTLELGEECSSSDHCKSHRCLEGDVGVCTKTCSPIGDACPAGFACIPVHVTLHNQGGFHDLGAQTYCMRAPAAAAAPPPSTSPPAAVAPPPATTTQAPPPKPVEKKRPAKK